jgi:DNA-3-methyladenine glycosylase
MTKLQNDFYNRKVTDVAAALIGKIFVRIENDFRFSGKIVEVEAYEGLTDEASHSYSGMTKRNKVMFGPPGVLYVYFTYGMHCCANVVTGPEGQGDAVLIRAVEPVEGTTRMLANRQASFKASKKISPKDIVNGPAKLCSAFNIGLPDNGTALSGDYIFIEEAPPVQQSMIMTSRRIGIKKAAELPWRFFLKNNSYISNYKKDIQTF